MFGVAIHHKHIFCIFSSFVCAYYANLIAYILQYYSWEGLFCPYFLQHILQIFSILLQIAYFVHIFCIFCNFHMHNLCTFCAYNKRYLRDVFFLLISSFFILLHSAHISAYLLHILLFCCLFQHNLRISKHIWAYKCI